ncbi:MAG: Crp/Fnr family transcriptional regulator [Clostridiales bacterium]|nr:Crp/Fnr family transcriptional regulator [Clostridiales bacterium]
MYKNDEKIYETIMLKELKEEDIKENIKKGKFIISSFEKNSVVHFEGDACNNLEIIISGRVSVDRLDETGGILTISEFTEGDMIGGNLLFSKLPKYPMTIITKEDTVIIKIERELLFELFRDNSSFLRKYLEYVTDHSVILSHKIKEYMGKSIRESIISYLEYEVIRQGSNCVTLNLTKKDLAEKLGVQRTSLSRELTKMKNDGLIYFDRESITLIDG